ncbi:MAG: glutaredoxin 3 [bacterium]
MEAKTPEVVMYTTTYCGYCHRAKMLMEEKQVPFEEINLDLQPERYGEMLSRAEGRRTVPQIFVNGQGIGGCDEMYDLERKGQLDELLATVG